MKLVFFNKIMVYVTAPILMLSESLDGLILCLFASRNSCCSFFSLNTEDLCIFYIKNDKN